MFVLVVLTLVLAAKPPAVLPPNVVAPGGFDPRQDLLDAMVEEINRSQAELKLRENRGPYFIAYQLKDYDAREVVARYGAVFQDVTTRDRKIGVDVRVGDYTFDGRTFTWYWSHEPGGNVMMGVRVLPDGSLAFSHVASAEGGDWATMATVHFRLWKRQR